jgi:hypothetical protein
VRVDHAVAALFAHTGPEALKARLLAGTGGVAAVVIGGITVVAGLVAFEHAVAAEAARLTGDGTRPAYLDRRAVGVTAVGVEVVAVVTDFGAFDHTVAAFLA